MRVASILIGKRSSKIFLKSFNYSFVTFCGLIGIFVRVLAAQTYTGQAGPIFKKIQFFRENNVCKFFRFRFSYGDPFGMTSFCILNQSETSLDVIELSGGTPSSGA